MITKPRIRRRPLTALAAVTAAAAATIGAAASTLVAPQEFLPTDDSIMDGGSVGYLRDEEGDYDGYGDGGGDDDEYHHQRQRRDEVQRALTLELSDLDPRDQFEAHMDADSGLYTTVSLGEDMEGDFDRTHRHHHVRRTQLADDCRGTPTFFKETFYVILFDYLALINQDSNFGWLERLVESVLGVCLENRCVEITDVSIKFFEFQEYVEEPSSQRRELGGTAAVATEGEEAEAVAAAEGGEGSLRTGGDDDAESDSSDEQPRTFEEVQRGRGRWRLLQRVPNTANGNRPKRTNRRPRGGGGGGGARPQRVRVDGGPEGSSTGVGRRRRRVIAKVEVTGRCFRCNPEKDSVLFSDSINRRGRLLAGGTTTAERRELRSCESVLEDRLMNGDNDDFHCVTKVEFSGTDPRCE